MMLNVKEIRFFQEIRFLTMESKASALAVKAVESKASVLKAAEFKAETKLKLWTPLPKLKLWTPRTSTFRFLLSSMALMVIVGTREMTTSLTSLGSQQFLSLNGFVPYLLYLQFDKQYQYYIFWRNL